MENKLKFIILLLFLYGIQACSTQKDRFLNREYHSINTKFNVLFNGQEALDIGIAILESQSQDNFLQTLPVELITLDGEDVNATASIPSFIRAEEKAVKAIQKHSINIKGVQKNRQIDKAYLLLGKSRYYDRRFLPALEAFNYLLSLYSDADVFYEGKLWREKTNLRLGNDELVIANLKPLANNIPKRNKLYPEVNATLAQAFLNLKQKDSALKYIKKAAFSEKQKNIKARYAFIEAQIFEELGQKDSAQIIFNSIVQLKRKAPRLYWMHAKLNSLRINLELKGENPEKELYKLSSAYENKRFTHLIYRQYARYFINSGLDSIAKKYYNKSNSSPGIDRQTLRQNYRDLADAAFLKGRYVETGSYLDSLLSQFPSETKHKKFVSRERDGLQDIVVYENKIKYTDSILSLSKMLPQEQLAYFQKAIDQKRAKELEKISLEKKSLFNVLGGSNGKRLYFYNENLVLLGKQEFASTYGNRPNIDDWNRIETLRGSVSFNNNTDQVLENKPIVKENAQAYVNLIPTDLETLDSLRKERNRAFLEVGILYKEKFKNNLLSSKRLKELLVNKPNDTQELNAWYHLYKMDLIDNPSSALVYKDQILKQYPNSRFARIIKDPENFKLRPNETPTTRYESLYSIYQEQKYEEVLTLGDDLLVIFSGTPMASKVALLMANASGRLDGVEVWTEKLKSIIKEYPSSEVAAQAKTFLFTLENNEKIEEQKVFANYKLIFPTLKNYPENLATLTSIVTSTLAEASISYKNLSFEIYNRDYLFLVVNGLTQKPNVVFELPKKTPAPVSTAISNKFVVLSSVYKEIQLLKSWNSAVKQTLYEK